MKHKEHIDRAKQIGDDSWELLNFMQLPQDASAGEQAEALEKDKTWQQDKNNEISRAIHYLIGDITASEADEG